MALSKRARAIRRKKRAARAKPFKPVLPSKALTADYVVTLTRIVDQFVKLTADRMGAIETAYNRVVSKDSLEVADADGADVTGRLERLAAKALGPLKKFEQAGYRIAWQYFLQAELFHRATFINTVNDALGVDLTRILARARIDRTVRQTVAQNVALIVDLPDQYYTKIAAAITEGADTGKPFTSVAKRIEELEGITKRRARFIARDQMSKFNNNLSQIRQRQLGGTHYKWRTSRDSRVGKDHKKLEGKRIPWKRPPKTGHPGKRPNCRCYPEPDLSTFL